MIALWTAAVFALMQEKTEEPQITQISVHRSPKGVKVLYADRPAVTIEITKSAGKDGKGESYGISLTINRAEGGAKAPVTITMALSKDAWDEAVKLVTEKKLAEWKPEDEKPVAAHGETGFEIQGKPANAQKWKGPAKNLEAPNALIAWMNKKAMAAFKNARIGWQ